MTEPHKLLPCPFERYIQKTTKGCWLWMGAVQSRGYGNYRGKLAHRVSYQKYKGEIPKGMTIDHICRDRLCVNPEHLRVMTQKDNNLCGESPVAVNKRKTHCSNGHELNSDNVKICRRKDGIRRKCMKCEAEYKRRRRANVHKA